MEPGWDGMVGGRSHSSRSIGVPEVIGNDKVGKMREERGGKEEKSGTERKEMRPSKVWQKSRRAKNELPKGDTL